MTTDVPSKNFRPGSRSDAAAGEFRLWKGCAGADRSTSPAAALGRVMRRADGREHLLSAIQFVGGDRIISGPKWTGVVAFSR
jgi:hypothetical protein